MHAVLMVLGLMSLLLTVIQSHVAGICIPTNIADSMLPCRRRTLAAAMKHMSAAGPHNTTAVLDSCQSQVYMHTLASINFVFSTAAIF